jgi:hypothetical protein
MRKLELSLDSLRVDSFETEAPGSGRGTVFGHSHDIGCTDNTCGYTPECPGYHCTRGNSTCEFPTAVFHCCAPGWTDGDGSCYCLQPHTYYCSNTSGGESFDPC